MDDYTSGSAGLSERGSYRCGVHVKDIMQPIQSDAVNINVKGMLKSTLLEYQGSDSPDPGCNRDWG